MSADDGNKPKGTTFRFLEKSYEIRVGKIIDVKKYLRRLLETNRDRFSLEDIQKLEEITRDPPQTQAESGSEKTSDDGKGNEFQRGLPYDYSDYLVSKKKPGEPGGSLIDTRNSEKVSPDIAKYLRLNSSFSSDLLPDFMREKDPLSPEAQESLHQMIELIHRAAMLGPWAVRHVLEAAGIAPSMLKFFGMEAPHTPIKDFREVSDPRFRGYAGTLDSDFRDPFGYEYPVPLPPAYLIPSKPDTPMTPEEEKLRREMADAYRRVASCPRPWWSLTWEKWWSVPDSGTPPAQNQDDKPIELPESVKRIQNMLDRDKRLTSGDKEVIIFRIIGRGILSSLSQNKPGESEGDSVRREVEGYLARKASEPKTTLQIDAESGARLVDMYFTNLLENKYKIWLGGGRAVSNEEMVAAVCAIPQNRLDEDVPSEKSTIREVLTIIKVLTKNDDVRKAIEEKLKG